MTVGRPREPLPIDPEEIGATPVSDMLFLHGWTQEGLARSLRCTRQTVINQINAERAGRADRSRQAQCWLLLQHQERSRQTN